MSASKPPTNMTPERTAVLALAMPLVQALAAEISKLPPDVQRRRIEKVLAAMCNKEKVH